MNRSFTVNKDFYRENGLVDNLIRQGADDMNRSFTVNKDFCRENGLVENLIRQVRTI